MTDVVLSALGGGLLLLAFDFQRRWFANQSRQREHEATRVNAAARAAEELLASQKARDERNDRALGNFLKEQGELVKHLAAQVQKQSTAQVEKLAQMNRMGVRR